MKKYGFLAVAAAALLVAGQAMADSTACPLGGGHANKQAMLKKADTNGDGKISKEEFSQAMAKISERKFSHMDANGDGVIDEKDRGAYFDRMDANGDGQISREEFAAAHQRHNPCRK